MRAGEVGVDLGDRPALGTGQRERQAGVEALAPARRRPRGGCPTASRSIARLRITSTSCTRSSSSNASRRRARSLSAIDSGRWISCSAVAAVDQPEPAADGRRHRVGEPRGAHRSSAFSTQPAISHVLSWAFSLCG